MARNRPARPHPETDDRTEAFDPAEVERLRDELAARLNRLRAHIEAKRRQPWAWDRSTPSE